MFDIKLIREDQKSVASGLASKKIKVDLDLIIEKDQKRRDISLELDELRNQKNMANEEIGKCIKAKEDPKEKIASMKKVSQKISDLEPVLKDIQSELNDTLLGLPNLPHESVPVGGEEANQVVRSWGEPKTFDFEPKSHIELGESLNIIDFKRASKISGSGFILFKNEGARLERALYSFMLDVHTREHGYSEVLPPLLVNRDSMTGTGQLPKMEDDMYRLKEEDLFLIPTAEVPVTNMHRDEILKEEDLPVYYAAYSACFRREAGSYGKDTKGMIRVHQFDKVELVKFVKPETSYDELERLVENAQKIFELLEIPYRILLLATGDLSFAAAKCYDIEAFSPGVDQWLEVSSCSNFEDFQARRSNIRYKGSQTKKARHIHTLNGSGVALARTMIAILENYQTADGDVIIPKVLVPYMGGIERITSK